MKIQDKFEISFCKKALTLHVNVLRKGFYFSVEWSHYRISSTDSKVKTTLNVAITASGSERVK